MRTAIAEVAFIIVMACLGWQSASAGLLETASNTLSIDPMHIASSN